MLKRINYTDRRRIPRGQIEVKVDPTDPASFTIDLPADLLSNPDAEVTYVDSLDWEWFRPRPLSAWSDFMEEGHL